MVKMFFFFIVVEVTHETRTHNCDFLSLKSNEDVQHNKIDIVS